MVVDTVYRALEPMSTDESHRAFRALVNSIRDAIPLEGRLHSGLYRLAEYDYINHSDYLRTLEVYLENNCNAQKCSRLLYLHRNSLVYRIRRIQEIGGFDLSDSEELAYLRLSLLLDKDISLDAAVSN